MNDREKVKALVDDILEIMGYGDWSYLISLRINDLPNETIEKIANKVAQTVKTW